MSKYKLTDSANSADDSITRVSSPQLNAPTLETASTIQASKDFSKPIVTTGLSDGSGSSDISEELEFFCALCGSELDAPGICLICQRKVSHQPKADPDLSADEPGLPPGKHDQSCAFLGNQEAKAPVTLLDLPVELIVYVLSFLTALELPPVAATCRLLRGIIKDVPRAWGILDFTVRNSVKLLCPILPAEARVNI